MFNKDFVAYSITKQLYKMIQESFNVIHETSEEGKSLTPINSVFHYTSTEVLGKLLSTGTFWASHISFLNDAAEFKGSLEYLEKVFLNDKDTFNGIKMIEKSTKNFWNGIYSISFSKEGDLLQQWITYAKESGVSIELDFDSNIFNEEDEIVLLLATKNIECQQLLEKKLEELKQEKSISESLIVESILLQLSHIFYPIKDVYNKIFYYDKDFSDNSEIVEKMKNILIVQCENNPWNDDHLESSYNYLRILSSYIKDEKFRNEDEIRLAFFPTRLDLPLSQEDYKERSFQIKTKINYYRMNNGVLRPYINVKFCKKKDLEPKNITFDNVVGCLPLKSITIGPSGKQQKIFEGIIHRLKYGETNIWDYTEKKAIFFQRFNNYAETAIKRYELINQRLDENTKNIIIKKLKLQWEEENAKANFFKDCKEEKVEDNLIDEEAEKVNRIIENINEDNYFSKEGIWIKKSKIPYIF